ncbi:hypothetical protein GCM10027590_47150 [Nocardiopsis nanhaiensis]
MYVGDPAQLGLVGGVIAQAGGQAPVAVVGAGVLVGDRVLVDVLTAAYWVTLRIASILLRPCARLDKRIF